MPPARTHIAPTGRELFFDHDEIIVSKTDLTGKITYANRVFMKVSGYTEGELLGAPHSLIRHPDMPRSVFKLLWERLNAGHEVFAYVNNLARSGDNYWVLAHVTPSYGPRGEIVGFHSNRRVPEPSKVEAVSALYGMLSSAERREQDRALGLRRSTEMLNTTLNSVGKSYDEWIWTL